MTTAAIFHIYELHCIFRVGTLDGSIASVLPLAEKTYRRLLMLQNKLSDCLQHKAGLNPRSYRFV